MLIDSAILNIDSETSTPKYSSILPPKTSFDALKISDNQEKKRKKKKENLP